MKKIIFDGDPGHDDAIAMLLALASNKLEVLAVTTVGGNNTLENTTKNALRILELCKRTDIPVASGRNKPLYNDLVISIGVHGKSGMDGPELPEPKARPVSLSAVALIAKVIEESSETVTLVATGPFSNIALFLLCYPHLKSKIDCISVMGGGIQRGNRTAVAEFNIWNDPEAAQVVLESGIPVILHGLDVTQKAYITRDEIDLFRNAGNKISDFVADLLDFFAISCIDERKFKGCLMHDSCAVMSLIHPEIFSYFDANISIELDGRITRGSCFVDMDGGSGDRTNCRVASDVDRAAFLKYLLNSCEVLADGA